MTEILYFSLGIATALVITGVAVVFRLVGKVKLLEQEKENLWQSIDSAYLQSEKEVEDVYKSIESSRTDIGTSLESIYRELESLRKDLEHQIEENYKETRQGVDEIYRTIDSRFDKFENKLISK